MGMKAKCKEHGSNTLNCGCHISVLESDSDFHEILRAKDKWINELLNTEEELKQIIENNELEITKLTSQIKRLNNTMEEQKRTIGELTIGIGNRVY